MFLVDLRTTMKKVSLRQPVSILANLGVLVGIIAAASLSGVADSAPSILTAKWRFASVRQQDISRHCYEVLLIPVIIMMRFSCEVK